MTKAAPGGSGDGSDEIGATTSQRRAREATEMERDVAQLYRELGAQVEHDKLVGGRQVDVLVTEHTSGGSAIRKYVDTKHFASRVGVGTVTQVSVVVDFLKSRGYIDIAQIISSQGFTKEARLTAADAGIELLEFSDLVQRVRDFTQKKPGVTPASDRAISDRISDLAPLTADTDLAKWLRNVRRRLIFPFDAELLPREPGISPAGPVVVVRRVMAVRDDSIVAQIALGDVLSVVPLELLRPVDRYSNNHIIIDHYRAWIEHR